MSDLHSLEKLAIAENQLIELPDSFESLVRLKIVELKKNKLHSLPNSLTKLKSLQYLGLANNPIVISPEELLSLDNLVKLNGQIGFDSLKKRKLLQFLKTCKKQKVADDLRFPFYSLMNDAQSKIPLNILIKALSFRNLAIQTNALKCIIENHGQQKKLEKGCILSFVGKTLLKIKEIESVLLHAGIGIESVLSEKVTHIVLGINTPHHEILLKNKFTFISERDLNAFINTISSKNSKELNTLEIEKVSDLLTSRRTENIEIAIQILKGSNNHQAILTELFIAYKTTPDKKQKARLRSMLTLNISENSVKLLNLPIAIFKSNGSKRLENVKRKLAEAGFDIKKLKQLIIERG
jgi:hypothetical protein